MDFPHHLGKACALELRFVSEQRDVLFLLSPFVFRALFLKTYAVLNALKALITPERDDTALISCSPHNSAEYEQLLQFFVLFTASAGE